MIRIGTIIIGVLFVVTAPALAQDVSTSPTPAPFPRVQRTDLRQSAQRIHLRMTEVNRNRMAAFESIIVRLRAMLERITAIADRYEARGADAGHVYEAVAGARRALDAAQAAIREQAGREYLLEGATDLTVREQLQGMREQLADDIANVAELLRVAMEKVREAVRALRSIRIP